MEEERRGKRRLVIDWEKLLPRSGVEEEEPPPEVVIAMSADQHSEIQLFSDQQLEDKIRRLKPGTLTLVDGGLKLKSFVKRLEDERDRRRLIKIHKVNDESKKPSQSQKFVINGPPNGSWLEGKSPTDHPQSSFGKEFSKRIDENQNSSSIRVDKEFANFACRDHGRKRLNGHVSQKSRQKRRSSPRQRSVQSSRSFSLYGNRHPFSNGDLNGGGSSTSSLRRHKESSLNRWNDFQVPRADDSRASVNRAVVNIDEEEDGQTIEKYEHAEELTQCMIEAKIYFPSRDDPDPVIISYADTRCLAPEAYLTSTIMNFYIRYLQQQLTLTNRVICDYLFFNTYFYEKLKEAVTYKGTGENTKFVKFRRWWKGVNIFHKAYVLIPIHQDLHWSLAIICIPDKDDDSGPIILHLDSLGLHSSRLVFDNIKSFMKEEWNFLNQEVADTDLPIADTIWKHLPRRIEEKKIEVPRQRNDYDCGLFVLFFMERFILDAPKRLVTRKNLPSMFGREWFEPSEASGLRKKIRVLLEEEFRSANGTSPIVITSPKSENADDAELVSDE